MSIKRSVREPATVTLAAALLLAGCGKGRAEEQSFPDAHRPVAPIVSSRWSDEESRDRLREADTVMDLAGIQAGMTVADIGAGEGYYTVRLAERVGASGRVLAQDIMPAVRDRLADRVARESLDNISVKLGEPADPKLPENSFDRIFLVHMYHEIGAPYEFLWRMHPSLRPRGRVVVVDADRPTTQHGTPPMLLDCEMQAVGYRKVAFQPMRAAGAYFAMYEAAGARPDPDDITPCELPLDPAPPRN